MVDRVSNCNGYGRRRRAEADLGTRRLVWKSGRLCRPAGRRIKRFMASPGPAIIGTTGIQSDDIGQPLAKLYRIAHLVVGARLSFVRHDNPSMALVVQEDQTTPGTTHAWTGDENMLRKLRELEHFVVDASDGDVGSVTDFLVDDESWTIKHLVVQTGGFFDGRRVLISPASFRQADWEAHRFRLALTVDKVKNSPSVDVDKPVSRQHERDFALYYGYPYYGGVMGLGGLGAYPGLLAGGGRRETSVAHSDQASGDVHLRSAAKLRGYHIQGTDEAIGHVDDFIVDDQSWELRYLVIDTSNWWFGQKVLVAPGWASRVSWEEQKVYVDMSRQAIKNSPVWNAAAPVDREYEIRLYDHYGRLAYWAGDKRPRDAQQPQHADAPR